MRYIDCGCAECDEVRRLEGLQWTEAYARTILEARQQEINKQMATVYAKMTKSEAIGMLRNDLRWSGSFPSEMVEALEKLGVISFQPEAKTIDITDPDLVCIKRNGKIVYED